MTVQKAVPLLLLTVHGLGTSKQSVAIYCPLPRAATCLSLLVSRSRLGEKVGLVEGGGYFGNKNRLLACMEANGQELGEFSAPGSNIWAAFQ